MEIFKVILNTEKINEEQFVKMPKNSILLDAAWQGGQLVVWYFNANQETFSRSFYIAFTGATIPEGFSHLRSLQNEGFVFHVLYK